MVLCDQRAQESQDFYEGTIQSMGDNQNSFDMTRVLAGIFDEVLEQPILHDGIDHLDILATISSREQLPCLWSINGNLNKYKFALNLALEYCLKHLRPQPVTTLLAETARPGARNIIRIDFSIENGTLRQLEDDNSS